MCFVGNGVFHSGPVVFPLKRVASLGSGVTAARVSPDLVLV